MRASLWTGLSAIPPQMPPVVNKDQLVQIFLFVALVGLLILLVELLAPYASPIAWAVILAVVFHPAHRRLAAAMPNWTNASAGVSTFLVFAVVVVPTLLLSGVVAREAIEGYQRFAVYVGETGYAEILNRVGHTWPIEPVWSWTRERMAATDTDPTSFLLSGLRWASEFAAARAAQIARNVFSFFVGLGILVFTLFFAFRDGPSFLDRFVTAIPMAERDRDRLFTSLQVTIKAVVQGLTATAALQSAMVGSALWLLGVPFTLLLSSATFVLAFLPVGGAALIWAPCAIGLALTGHVIQGILLAIWGAAAVSSIDNFVRPVLIGTQAKISTPVLFFGIVGGLQAYGIIGLFVGPSLLAAFACLLSIYREQYLDKQAIAALE